MWILFSLLSFCFSNFVDSDISIGRPSTSFIGGMSGSDHLGSMLSRAYDLGLGSVINHVPTTLSASQLEYTEPADEGVSNLPSDRSGSTLLGVFIAGFLGGLAAIVMPCIFPMLPLTVSCFTKFGSSRGKTVRTALQYGLSIILIYVTLGMVITVAFGSDALNEMATNGAFNLIFFAVLVTFGLSFLGAFNLTLPSKFVNTIDRFADGSGHLAIFFMAASLALVSFSCTAPIVGTLLVEAAVSGSYLAPVLGMLGFSIALALPFTFFAMFPGWLKAMPKSGDWLNSIKVVLGFLELALALKFLSNVDLAYHWGWLDRETFLIAWIVIFGFLGLYFLGKITFSGESRSTGMSSSTLLLAMASFAFTLYLVRGLWGAPVNAIAGFLPPSQAAGYPNLNTLASMSKISSENRNRKYAELFHAPLGIEAFFDLEEGMAYARKVNKPVLVDFTGHACVNCRKMEATVWPHPDVLKRLREDYIVIQLYVDDKTTLPPTEQSVSSTSSKMIKTIGNKWSDLQASKFNSNSQPYYVLLGHNKEVLIPPKGADYDAESYKSYLDEGLAVFNDR